MSEISYQETLEFAGMEQEPKENMCRILFDCKDFDGNVCSHNNSRDRCKYSKSKTTSGVCLSQGNDTVEDDGL